MIDENIVREEQQPSTSPQNQSETTAEPKQSFSGGHNSDIISMNEVRYSFPDNLLLDTEKTFVNFS